jgi:hypothetical protein
MALLSSTVWMVNRLTGREGVEGELTLERERLEFAPLEDGEPAISLSLVQIRRVRRLLASPVLEVALHTGREPPLIGFYFTPPPRLVPPERTRLWGRHSAKRAAIFQLMQANPDKKREIQQWVRLIRELQGDRRTASGDRREPEEGRDTEEPGD